MLNNGYTYSEIVDHRGGGFTLSAYLASRHHHTSEAEWGVRIAGGLVRVNGLRAVADQALRPGSTVEWLRPPWHEADVPLEYGVLHEDDDLVAVAKPSGLPTVPGGGFLENTLLARVRLRYPAASPVHRLGRGTSGVIVFALTSAAASSLARIWRDKLVTKVYRALVEGIPARDSFIVDTPIGPAPHDRLGHVHAAVQAAVQAGPAEPAGPPTGKEARSEVRVLQRREGSSLVEVRIETGRPHQIRIHMAACGHPLVGDPLYVAGGGFRAGGAARPGDVGYLLHAMRLSFPHPATGRPFEVFCEPPAPLALE